MPPPSSPMRLATGTRTFVEAVDGMMGGVVVGVGGGADHSDARGFHVDEEEAVGAGMGAVGELGLEDEMIGDDWRW